MTLHRRALFLSLAAATALVATTARADRASVLKEASGAAKSMRYFGYDKISVNSRYYDLRKFDEKLATCHEKVKAALATGIKPDEEYEFGLPDHYVPKTREAGEGRDRVMYTTLGKLQAYCKSKDREAQALRAYLAASAAYYETDDMERKRTAYQYHYGKMLHTGCVREVTKALKMGAKKDLQFERPDAKLGEALDKVCKPLGDAVAGLGDELRKKTDVSAFHKGMSDAKRKVFDEYLLWDSPVFGDAKYPLKDAEDFEYKDIWFVQLKDKNEYGETVWVVKRFEFADGKLVSTKDLRGEEDEPPASLFK